MLVQVRVNVEDAVRNKAVQLTPEQLSVRIWDRPVARHELSAGPFDVLRRSTIQIEIVLSESITDCGGRAFGLSNKKRIALFRKLSRSGGDAYGSNRTAARVEHGRSDAAQSQLIFFVIQRKAVLDDTR